MPAMQYPSFYSSADEMAATNQKQYMEAIRLRLIFLAFAALGGAVSLNGERIDWFAWLALVAFVAAIACEVFILTQRPDQRWYEGRAAAESAKTVAWRFAVGGDPFPTTLAPSDAARLLVEQVRDLASDLQYVTAAPADSSGGGLPDGLRALRERPFDDRRDHYLTERVRDQITWYTGKSRTNARNQVRFLIMTIVLEFLGVIGAALRIADIVDVDVLGILAAVAAGAASWAQTRQYGQLSRAYAVAANELTSIEAQARLETESGWPRFVDEAEEAISREHTLWRASRGVPLGRRRRA